MDHDGIIQEEFQDELQDESTNDSRSLLPIQSMPNAISCDVHERTALLVDDSTEDVRRTSAWDGDKDFKGLSWRQRPSIYWLLPAFALYTLAVGGVIVPKINLVKDLVCRDYLANKLYMDPNDHHKPVRFGGNNNECRDPAISGRATIFLMGDSILGGLLGAIVSPYLGGLSDRYGRKGMMIFTSAGGLIKEVTSILASTYPKTFPLGFFYVGFVADGLCGSFIAGLAFAHCYATDCTPPAKRSVAFGWFQGMLFTGVGLGPIVAGFIIEYTGSLLSMFYIALACHLVFMFNVAFIVPESLSKQRQEEAREKHRLEEQNKTAADRVFSTQFIRLFTGFLRPLRILWPTTEGSSPMMRRNLVLLCAIDTTMFGVAMGVMTVVILYTDQQFSWGNLEQSGLISVVSITRVAGLFVLLPILVRLLRGSASKREEAPQNGCDWVDLVIIRIAVFFDTLGFLGYTLSQTGPLFIVSGCVAAFGGIGSPTLQSSLTKHVPADKTGQVLGASAMLHALARIVAPLIFSTIFWATVGMYNQAVFLCVTITFTVTWTLTWFLRSGVYVEESNLAISEAADDTGQIGQL